MKDYTANMDVLQERVILWADKRGIYKLSSPEAQYTKLLEEVSELLMAIKTNNKAGIIDGIGDSIVVLTNLAEFYNLSLNQCFEAAWIEIADRKGKMVNGFYVKGA